MKLRLLWKTYLIFLIFYRFLQDHTVCRMSPKPAFFIVCGDLVDAFPDKWPEIRSAQEKDFFKVFSKLNSDIPLVCVCGNHDVGKSFIFKYQFIGILSPKLFWPTVRKNCSGDREKLLKFEAEGREFAKFLRSLENSNYLLT